jgi:hypothetical protein
MKLGLRYLILGSAAAFAVSLMLSPSALAQKVQPADAGKSDVREPKPLPPGGPAPRTADGHPDLSGVWFPGCYGSGDLNAVGLAGNYNAIRRCPGDRNSAPEEPPPFQPWAAAKYKEMFPSEVEIQLHSPSTLCLPRGVPISLAATPYPVQFVQTPGLIAQLNEVSTDFRIIYTDGRAHSKDPDPAFNGESIGHWEGDTLVIDVIGIDDRTWNNLSGWFHSDEEHVVERLTRTSMNYLTYQFTIEDPKVLTKPWKSSLRTKTLGHEPLEEFYCTHTEEYTQFNDLKKVQQPKDK